MKLINNPDRSQWAEILKRPVMNTENLFDTVRGIIDRVKSDGDRAVLEMEAKFDKAELTSLAVTEAELKDAETLVDEKCFWEIIGKLKSLGAEGILVLPIEKMIL